MKLMYLSLLVVGSAMFHANGLDLEAISSRSQDAITWADGIFVGRLANFEYRSSMVFDLSSVSGVVTSATLQLYTFSYASTAISETVQFRDSGVSQFSTASLPTFSDLGSGVFYGSLALSSADENKLISLVLNPSAVAAINSNLGGSFSIGGSLSTLDGSESGGIEGLFLGSTPEGIQRLTLTFAPVPECNPLLPALGSLVGMGAIRVLRQTRK